MLGMAATLFLLVIHCASNISQGVSGPCSAQVLAGLHRLDKGNVTYCRLPAGSNVPEVDSVLATSEVQQLLEQQAVSFPDLPCLPVDSVLGPAAPKEQLHGVHGGSGVLLSFVDSLGFILLPVPLGYVFFLRWHATVEKLPDQGVELVGVDQLCR